MSCDLGRSGVLSALLLLWSTYHTSIAQTPTFTWDGGGADDNWATASNWNPDGMPTNGLGTDVVFAGSMRLTPNINVPWSINSLAFSNSTSSYFTIGGAQLTIGAGGVTNNSSFLQTINDAVLLAAPQTWNAASGNLKFGGSIDNGGVPLTFTGPLDTILFGAINGTGGLTKTGSGMLTLFGSPANSYSGITTVEAGTLALGRTLSIVGSALQINGGIVREDGNNQIADSTPVTINAGGLLQLNNYSDALSTTILNGGSISTGATGFVSPGNLTSNANATTATISGRVNQNASNTWMVNAGTTASGIDLEVPAVVFGSAGITKQGPGTLRLSGANTYSGFSVILAGKVVLGNSTALGSADGGTFISGGATLDLNGQDIGAESIGDIIGTGVDGNGALVNSSAAGPAARISGVVSLDGPTTIGGAGNITLAGRVFGGTALTKAGAGTLTFEGTGDNTALPLVVSQGTVVLAKTNSASGHAVGGSGVVVSGGTLKLAGSGNDQIYDNSDVTMSSGGTFDFNAMSETFARLNPSGGSGGVITNNAVGTSTMTIGNAGWLGDNGTFAGVIQDGVGKMGLTKNGSGILTLSGANTYSGATTVLAGTLQGGATNAFSPNSPVVVSSGATLNLGAVSQSVGSLAGGGLVTTNNNLNVAFATLTLGSDDTSTSFSGVIQNSSADQTSVSVTKVGMGTMTLNRPSGNAITGHFYSTGLTIAGGTIREASNNQIDDSVTVTLNAGATLALDSDVSDSFGETTFRGGSITTAGAGFVSSQTINARPSSTTATISGRLKGTNGEPMIGLYAFGGYTANGIDLDIPAVLFGTGNVRVFGPGTLRLSGANTFSGPLLIYDLGTVLFGSDSLSGSGPAGTGRILMSDAVTIKADGGPRTLTNDISHPMGITIVDGSNNLTLNGIISGDGGLSKYGSGTLTLGGTNTYTALTAVNAGAMAVNGSVAGSVRVYAGGALQGTGHVFGRTIIEDGAAISPGNGAGALTVFSLRLASGATTNIELGGTTRVSQYDALISTSSDAVLNGTLNVSLINGFMPAAGQSFDIFDWFFVVSGTFSSISLPSIPGLAWDTSQLYTTGTISVTSAGVLGDYNHNGIVDAADYVFWRKGLGTTYVQNDFNIWRANFGQTAASGAGASSNAAIPEPATLMLTFLAVAGRCLLRRSVA